MARHKKQTVDYFPHSCKHGKTMFIIEQKYGNDGYAFWLKLLEFLGDTAGHYIDLNDEVTQEFLQAKTRLSWDFCEEILDLLAKLDAIDAELWEYKVVWSQNFVDGISDVYKNRRTKTPSRPSFYVQKPCNTDVSTDNNPQSKVKKSKVKEINNIRAPVHTEYQSGGSVEADKVTAAPDIPEDKPPKPQSGPRSPFKNKRQEQLFDRFWEQYPKKRSKGQAEKAWVKLQPDEQLLETMLAALERAKKSEEWRKENGRYIPYPATWLSAKGWEDEYSSEEVIGNANGRGDPEQDGYKLPDDFYWSE